MGTQHKCLSCLKPYPKAIENNVSAIHSYPMEKKKETALKGGERGARGPKSQDCQTIHNQYQEKLRENGNSFGSPSLCLGVCLGLTCERKIN